MDTVNPQTLLQKLLQIAAILLIFALSTYLLQEFGSVVKPFFIALFILYMIRPIREWLIHRGISGLVSYFVIVCLFLIATLFVANLLYSTYNSLANDPKKLEEYKTNYDQIKSSSIKFFANMTHNPNMFDDWTGSKDFPKFLMSLVQRVVGSFVGFLGVFFIVVLYLVFMIAESQTLPSRLHKAFGDTTKSRVMEVAHKINDGISDYIAVKSWVGLATAIISFLVLWFMGIDFAFVSAVLIFLLNFIPYLGSLVATLFPIIIALLQFSGYGQAVTLAIILPLLQVISGQIVETRVAGKKLNLSPLLLLLALAFWGTIWGIVGMLLAVPITSALKIVFDNMSDTKPIGIMMSSE